MRLAQVTVKDFRGFSREETFNLGDGKNLLLYGENGSGKSSLYRALVEFFNRDRSAKPYRFYRNIFLSDATKSCVDGHVTLEMSDGSKYEWRCLGERPWKDLKVAQASREQLTDAANRAALLDYRSLLRTNFETSNLNSHLFQLAVTTLLANAPVAITGGSERTIGQLWRALNDTVPGYRERHTKRRLASLASAEKTFNDGLKGILPAVQDKAAEFLGFFENSDLELKLDFAGVNYEQYHKKFCS